MKLDTFQKQRESGEDRMGKHFPPEKLLRRGRNLLKFSCIGTPNQEWSDVRKACNDAVSKQLVDPAVMEAEIPSAKTCNGDSKESRIN